MNNKNEKYILQHLVQSIFYCPYQKKKKKVLQIFDTYKAFYCHISSFGTILQQKSKRKKYGMKS
jgi:hypothetical protein